MAGRRTSDTLIVGARHEGTRIHSGVKDLSIGISYVTDQSLLDDASVDFHKCAYVAIGVANVAEASTDGGTIGAITRRIGRLLGLGER